MSRSLAEQIIEFAIDKERLSISFYEELARKVADPSVKDEILRMADEERKHERLLKQLSPKKIDLTSKEGVSDFTLSRYSDEIPKQPQIDIEQLFLIAIDREQKSFEFYQDLELRAIDDSTRKLFTLLKGEEIRHKRQLEERYSQKRRKQN